MQIITSIHFNSPLLIGHKVICELFPMLSDMPVMAYFNEEEAKKYVKQVNSIHLSCYHEDNQIYIKSDNIYISARYLNIKIVDGGPNRDDSVTIDKLTSVDSNVSWMIEELDSNEDNNDLAGKILVKLMYHEIQVDPLHISFDDKDN